MRNRLSNKVFIILMILAVCISFGFTSTFCQNEISSEQSKKSLDSLKQEVEMKSDTIVFNHPQLGNLILPRIPFCSLDSMASAEMLRIGYFNSHYHLADTIKARCERLGLGGYNFPEDYLKPVGKKKFHEIHKKLKQMPQRSDATTQEIELYFSMMDELATIIRTHNTGRPLLQFYQEDEENDIKINGNIK